MHYESLWYWPTNFIFIFFVSCSKWCTDLHFILITWLYHFLLKNKMQTGLCFFFIFWSSKRHTRQSFEKKSQSTLPCHARSLVLTTHWCLTNISLLFMRFCSPKLKVIFLKLFLIFFPCRCQNHDLRKKKYKRHLRKTKNRK